MAKAPQALKPFRVHFTPPETAPLDVSAENANEARKLATARRPDAFIRKIKIIREQHP